MFFVDFKNENVIAWRTEGQPAAMAPDLICWITLDGTPLTNADMKEGLKVAATGIPASEKWRKHPKAKAFDVWRHILEPMGCKGDYIPIERLL